MTTVVPNHNNGCVVAMCGENCVAIATDHRFTSDTQTICTDFKKVLHISPYLFHGMTGLQADILTVRDRMAFRKNITELNEERSLTPQEYTQLFSSFLYEHRFAPYFVDSVVAGLQAQTSEPYVCNLDSYGYANITKDFVVAGNCAAQVYGMCETLWEPGLKPNQLFEVISQSMIVAMNRDAMTGWGATVYVLEHDKLTERSLKTRMD